MLSLRSIQPVIESATLTSVADVAQDIARLSADLRTAQGYRKISLQRTINEMIDDMLSLFLARFSGTLSPAETRAIMAEHYPLTERSLGKLDPRAIPLVVMRELIAVHRVIIDRINLRHWSDFAKRWNHAVN